MGMLSVKDNLVCKEILKIQFSVFRGDIAPSLKGLAKTLT